MFLASCRDDKQVDVKSPLFAEFTVNSVNGSEVAVAASEEAVIDFMVTDNMSLNQVRLTLIADDASRGTPNTGTWEELEILNLNGTSAERSVTFSIPDSITGYWLLKAECIDDMGLAAQPVNVKLNVLNANCPQVTGSTIPAADGNGVVQIPSGSNLGVSGTATDSDNFTYLKVYLTRLNGTVQTSLNIEPVLNSPFGFSGATFDNAQAGSYRLIIEAKDQQGFTGKWGTFVNVN